VAGPAALLAIGIMAGLVLLTCSVCDEVPATAATATSSSTAWLNGTAAPMKNKLNADQSAIDTAIVPWRTNPSAANVAAVLKAYAVILGDVATAGQGLPTARTRASRPSSRDPLVRSWITMVNATGSYANTCSKLFRVKRASPAQLRACTAAKTSMFKAIKAWNHQSGSAQSVRAPSTRPTASP
jgi:hypothetical protein